VAVGGQRCEWTGPIAIAQGQFGELADPFEKCLFAETMNSTCGHRINGAWDPNFSASI
jgi:hypothetical protein